MPWIKYLLSLWILGTGILFSGNVSLHVDKSSITKGEGINVTLTAKGKEITFPKIKTIGGFPIGQPQVSQKVQASYVNGTFTTLREKTLRFTFFPDTNVTIPSFAVTVDGKTEKTQPVTIHIGARTQGKSSQGKYELKMLTQRHNVYVGEPFLLQVIFYEPRSSAVTQAQYVAPKFEGFFVKSSPKERLEQTPGGTAHVFDYILTPQREGNFTITAPQIKLGIKTFSDARDPWGFFNNEIHWQALQGSPKTITVKPTPSQVDLVGIFTVKASVDSQSVRANKPVNYSLVFDGQGSLDDMDEPKFDLPDVTVYSDDPQSTTQVRNNQIVSHWEKKYTFIADHDFTIPALSFHVFNPKTGKTTTLKTKPYAIHISGGVAAQKPTTPAKPTVTPASIFHPKGQPASPKAPGETPKVNSEIQKPAAQDANRSLLEDTAYYAQQAKNKFNLPWWSLIAAFILGILTLFGGQKLLPLLKRRRSITRHRKYTPSEALDLLYPHTNDSPEIEAMVRDLYRAQRGEKVEIDSRKLNQIIEQLNT